MQKNDSRSGLFYALATFSLWGVFPIYFKLLSSLSYVEIVAHRIVWSVLLLAVVLKFSHKFHRVKSVLKNKKTALTLFITALLITANWTIYIYGVEQGRIVDTSLGYFINPFFNMLLGVLILKEKLDAVGKISAAIVVAAIALQIYDAGELPLIALFLPASFALYGLIRKQIKIPSLEGLFIETAFVFPLAVVALFATVRAGESHFSVSWFGALIALSGPATVVPLLLFNAAAVRLNLSVLGYLQYISPSMQFLIAVLIYDEKVGILKSLSFVLIWTALLLISLKSIKKGK